MNNKILDMLQSDGITDERLLEYKVALRTFEAESFLSGRYFERDGKGAALPVAARIDQSECDLFKQEQAEFLMRQKWDRAQREEEYNS